MSTEPSAFFDVWDYLETLMAFSIIPYTLGTKTRPNPLDIIVQDTMIGGHGQNESIMGSLHCCHKNTAKSKKCPL